MQFEKPNATLFLIEHPISAAEANLLYNRQRLKDGQAVVWPVLFV